MSEERGPGESWQEIVAGVLRSWEEGLQRAATVAAETFGRVDTWLEAARPVVADIGRLAAQFREAYDEGVPTGWQQLDSFQMIGVIALMRETGWCLTTTPPPEILIELLASDEDAQREAILLANEARILDDLDRELRAGDHEGLQIYGAAARQAWEAHAGGLFMASQSMSAVTLAALSHGRGPLALRTLGAARTRLESLDPEEAGLRELRFSAVANAVATALRTFPHTGPAPELFNRHATSHALSPVQFTQRNSLTALMLTCGWLREVAWLGQVARD